ncbi:MAG: hypothetical protein ACK5RG_11505 [Cyclobacteriaceae bacterium]|jgi:hypothetical protein|nr:hypothetical protein [Flammeovirgaceae bacterium]
MKARLGLIASIFLLLALQSIAQSDSLTDNVLTTKKLRYGIYRTFNEFKSNSPGITSGFTISIDSGEFIRRRLKDEKEKIIRRVYGFSDGLNIFLNAKVYDQTNYFVPILALGKITYFEDFHGKANSVANHSGIGTAGAFAGGIIGGTVGGVIAYQHGVDVAHRNPGWIIYMPDDDGYAYALSKKTLTSILKQYDINLLAEFNREKDQNDFDTLMKYLIEFNRKNSNW